MKTKQMRVFVLSNDFESVSHKIDEMNVVILGDIK